VSRSDRDLALALRSELAAVDPSRPCDRRAEALGLRLRLSSLPGAGHAARHDAPLARLFVRLGREIAVMPTTAGADAPERATLTGPFDWDGAADHCRTAWLRGVFLAHGSLSLAGGRTHLEFVIPADDAPELARRLASVDLRASWRIRRGRGVVTWKSGETVGVFLRRIGAAGALLEVEARQVSRALRGDLNRVLNAESANLQRAVGAAGRQVAAIEELSASGELAEQPFVVRLVAEARRETPEATLGELAERLDIHRSAVQRALERIEHLAASPDDEAASSRRRRRSGLHPAAARSEAGAVRKRPPSSMPLA
jgi:WhiA C-terminal HTH domain/WhiA LAGLIDADG-like domain